MVGHGARGIGVGLVSFHYDNVKAIKGIGSGERYDKVLKRELNKMKVK